MKTVKHKFVEFIPEELEDGFVYVSMEYRTAVHNCICGCGNKVVTPFSPSDWRLIFNGKSISLSPSIGNWNFECRSHYWIKNGKIEMAAEWSQGMIKLGRDEGRRLKEQYYQEKKIIETESGKKENPVELIKIVQKSEKKRTWLHKLFFGQD